jgi:hypothetical protein
MQKSLIDDVAGFARIRLSRERRLNPQRIGRRSKSLRIRMFRRRPLTLERDQKPNGPGRNKADNFAVRKQLLPVPANNKRRAVHRNCKEKISSPIIPNRASNKATARRANVTDDKNSMKRLLRSLVDEARVRPLLQRESKITSKYGLHRKAASHNRSYCGPWNYDVVDKLRKLRKSGAVFFVD